MFSFRVSPEKYGGKMKTDTRSREQKLLDIIPIYEGDLPRDLEWYINRHHEVNRGSILLGISTLHELRGLKAYFINNDLKAMKQQFYMACILERASRATGFDPGYFGLPFPVRPYLYALLSDSPECLDSMARGQLDHRDNPRSYHFYSHMLQLLLLDEHDVLREKIALGAKKCGKQLRDQLATGEDYFSLVLKRDKTALEAHIQNLTKGKPTDMPDDSFFKHWAVVCAKICWIKGIEVQIDHPLVPMPLLPVEPLDHYDVEYDFLRPGWTPPSPSLLDKLKRFLK